MTQRASFQETLEFCNAVREAGGANPLDALLPGIPEEPNECLIARNLNFSCQVGGTSVIVDQDVATGTEYPRDMPPDCLTPFTSRATYGDWFMEIPNDQDVVHSIANALDLHTVKVANYYVGADGYVIQEAIILPEAIGQVAADFDEAGRVDRDPEYQDPNEQELFEAFAPYIKQELTLG